MFKYLNFGGVYIIEDIGTSYMKSYYGDPYLSKKCGTYFSKYVHCANDYQLLDKYKKKFKRNCEIETIIFMKDAIVIKKKILKKVF